MQRRVDGVELHTMSSGVGADRIVRRCPSHTAREPNAIDASRATRSRWTSTGAKRHRRATR